ncbi:hypothetical protein MY4038_010131 [Beauveria bassiana]
MPATCVILFKGRNRCGFDNQQVVWPRSTPTRCQSDVSWAAKAILGPARNSVRALQARFALSRPPYSRPFVPYPTPPVLRRHRQYATTIFFLPTPPIRAPGFHGLHSKIRFTSHTTLLRSPLSAARWVADRMNRPGYGQGCWGLGTTIESHPSNVYGSLVAVWVVDRVDSFAWASATIWWAPRSGRDAYCQKVVARKIWRLDRHGDADGRGEAIVEGQTQPAIA